MVTVVAADAALLRLAGESVDGVMPFNGSDKEILTAGRAPPGSPRERACLLPLPLCEPLALAVALKTAVPCTSEAPCERDLIERLKRILQHREQTAGARGSSVTGLPSPPYLCYA
jgi:hypothetical protein